MNKPQKSSHLQRHCCVKGCPNAPLKGRKTCGRHGQKRRSTTTRRTRFIHLDCSIPTLRAFDDEQLASTAQQDDFPTDIPYRAGVTVRTKAKQIVALVGLPTSRENMIAFLEDWLTRSGNTLNVIEQLTPASLPRIDRDRAFANSAQALVMHELTGGVK